MSGQTHTPDEMRQAIDRLLPADLLRMEKAARILAFKAKCDAGDLLSEAVARVLTGSRRCPRDVEIKTFLIGVMRSLSSAFWEQSKTSVDVLELAATGTDDPVAVVVASTDRNAEEWCLAKDDTNRRITALEELFEGDDAAMMVLMGRLDGLTKEEIMTMNDLTLTDYGSLLRRMRRKIDGRFPHGWDR